MHEGNRCAIGRNRTFTTSLGATLNALAFAQFAEARGPAEEDLPASVSKAEQSNSSILYGNRLILKVFRRVEEGPNPDVEAVEYLTGQRFPHVPPLVGTISYTRADLAGPKGPALR